jgi:membrane associated rhomboid family serine protease
MNIPMNQRGGISAAWVVLGVTVLAYFVQMANINEALRVFALWPLATETDPSWAQYGVAFGPWQLISYGFLHGGLAHLFFNMFALYMFGVPIERAWGMQRFLIFYFFCMVGAGLVQLTVAAVTGEVYPTIGASGAVFGLLLAFGMMYPNNRIMLLIPPIPMKAKWFVIGYGVLTLIFGMTGAMPGIAHFAHLGGMLFGLALILFWGRQDFHRRRRS